MCDTALGPVVVVFLTLSLAGVLVVPVHAAQSPANLVLHVPAVVDATIGVNMSATLTGSAGNFTSGTVTWYLNGAEQGASYIVLGTCNPCEFGHSIEIQQSQSGGPVGKPMATGTYNATVTFSGNGNYLPVRTEAFFVALLPSHFVITTSPSFVPVGGNINVTEHLVTYNGTTVLGCVTWFVYVNGQRSGGGCVEGGSSEWGRQTTVSGNYTVVVAFYGSPEYMPAQAQATFEVLPLQSTTQPIFLVVVSTATVTVTYPGVSTVAATVFNTSNESQPTQVVVQQVDTFPLALAIVFAGAIVAAAMVGTKSRATRSEDQT